MNLETVIEEKLLSAFSPTQLDVVNENPHVSQKDKDGFFKVVIISKAFEGERMTKRHRAIYNVLADELIQNVARLALHTYTEREWKNYYDGNMALSAHCVRR